VVLRVKAIAQLTTSTRGPAHLSIEQLSRDQIYLAHFRDRPLIIARSKHRTLLFVGFADHLGSDCSVLDRSRIGRTRD